MRKMFLTTGIIAIILFFSTTFCYAAQDDTSSNNINLGDQITESMNKVEKSADNLKNNIKNNDMVNDMVEGVRDTENTTRTDYNATRTAIDNDLTNGTGMTGTNWIWIILAVVGVVILATVWFYAMQNSGRD